MARPPFRLYEQSTAPRGNVTPLARNQDVSSGQTGIARALGRVGQGVQQIADTSLEIERIQHARAQDDARVMVALRMAEARREAGDIRRRAFEEAPDGWQGAPERVAQDWSELRQRYLADPAISTPEAQTFLAQSLDLFEPELMDSAAEMQTTARRQWRADTTNSATDTLSGVINADPGQYEALRAQHVELISGLSDISADQRRALEARAEEQFALSAVAGMVERDPQSTLALLRDPDAEGPVSRLTGPQRDAYANRAQAELNRRQSEARAAQAQFTASLRDTVNAQRDLLRRGVLPSDPVDPNIIASALGPDVAQAFMGDLAGVAVQRGLATLPLGQVAQYASGAQSPDATDMGNMETAIVQEQAERSLTQRREDPGDFALRNGLMRTPENGLMATIGEAIQSGNWDGFEQAMRARSADSMELRRTGVVASVAPLSRNEARAMSSWLQELPEQARLGFFSQASANMNNEAYMAMMAQIAPEGAPVIAYAGARYADNPMVARRLLRGVEVLQGGPASEDGRRTPLVNMPSDEALQDAFNEEIADAYRGMPNAVGPTFEAFRAYYAAETERQGASSTPNTVDRARAHAAAGAATGGLINWNGYRTVMPPGMRATDFDLAVRQAFQTHGALSGLDPSHYTLRAVRGRYLVEGLFDANHSPIMIQVLPPR